LKNNVDQRGTPDPEWSFPQFRALGWNLIRVDGLDWGKFVKNETVYLANLKRFTDAANANGVWLIWGPGSDYMEVPADVLAGVQHSGRWTNWWSYWWSDGPYLGTDPSLQGLGIWEAWAKDFLVPIAKIVDPLPCTFAWKFTNEPRGINSIVDLAKFYAVVGAAVRTVSSNTYLVYEGPNANSGYAGFINEIQTYMPSGVSYKPAIYDIHYPNSTILQSDGAAAAANGVGFWNGECYSGWFSSSYLASHVSANAASNIFRWDEDGDLLMHSPNPDGYPTPTGTLTSTATSLSARMNTALGPAQFFR
jgi:hypothetical protein